MGVGLKVINGVFLHAFGHIGPVCTVRADLPLLNSSTGGNRGRQFDGGALHGLAVDQSVCGEAHHIVGFNEAAVLILHGAVSHCEGITGLFKGHLDRGIGVNVIQSQGGAGIGRFVVGVQLYNRCTVVFGNAPLFYHIAVCGRRGEGHAAAAYHFVGADQLCTELCGRHRTGVGVSGAEGQCVGLVGKFHRNIQIAAQRIQGQRIGADREPGRKHRAGRRVFHCPLGDQEPIIRFGKEKQRAVLLDRRAGVETPGACSDIVGAQRSVGAGSIVHSIEICDHGSHAAFESGNVFTQEVGLNGIILVTHNHIVITHRGRQIVIGQRKQIGIPVICGSVDRVKGTGTAVRIGYLHCFLFLSPIYGTCVFLADNKAGRSNGDRPLGDSERFGDGTVLRTCRYSGLDEVVTRQQVADAARRDRCSGRFIAFVVCTGGADSQIFMIGKGRVRNELCF